MKGYFFCSSASYFFSCKTLSSTSGNKDNGKIDVTFVQINDVYEIAPLNGGKEGGIAGVASGSEFSLVLLLRGLKCSTTNALTIAS